MRPSGAIGLAVRAKSPICVEEPVIRQGNVGEDDVPTPDEPTDTAILHRDEVESVLRIWLEAPHGRTAIADLNDYTAGIEMMFDLARREDSTYLLRGD